MKRFIAALVFMIFLLWIIPLGAFIQAHKEDQICNGRRAICLCTNFAVVDEAQVKAVKFKRQRQPGAANLQFPSFGGHFINSVQFYSFTDQFIGFTDHGYVYGLLYPDIDVIKPPPELS